MPEKKDHILLAALKLFAEYGYDATSTSKIAKEAGVSEGLIFRHYTNKQGLLDALMGQMKEKLSIVIGPIFLEQDPQRIIHMTIEMLFGIPESEFPYWRLQHMLKWNPIYNNPTKMDPFIDHLAAAFEKLGAEAPKLEAQHLWYALEGAGATNLKGMLHNKQAFKEFMLQKYTF